MIARTDAAADPFADEFDAATASYPEGIGAEAPIARRRGWRRWMQVNLLMVLVALGILSGYFALRRNYLVPYIEQKEAREALAQKGAQFSAAPASPKWIQFLFQLSDDDFQNVEMIKLEHRDVRDADLVALHKFPHLRRLYLASTPITDEGVKRLRYCPQLRRISLWDTQVGDAGIAQLETLTDLRILDIHRTWTTDEALRTLGKLPALEELVLDDSTTSRGVAHLAGLRTLRRLDVQATGLTAECLELLADCPIESLQLNYAFVNRENAAHLRFLPRLRTLEVDIPGATDADLAWIGEMRNLRHLSLHWLQADGAFASEIAKLPRLERLHVDSDRLRTRHVKKFLAAPRLKDAAIFAIDFTNEDWKNVSFDRELREVSIYSPWTKTERSRDGKSARLDQAIPVTFGNYHWVGGTGSFDRGAAGGYEDSQRCYVTAADLAPLLRQKNVLSVNLRDWHFAPGALAELAKLRDLQDLALVDCEFSPEDFEALATLPELRHVTVHSTPVPDSVIAALAKAPNLARLTAPQTDASPETALALVRKASLTRIELGSTALDDAFLAEFEKIVEGRFDRAKAEGLRIPDFKWDFQSPGFTPSRSAALTERFRTIARVADTFSGEYRGDSPAPRRSGVWQGSVDLADPAIVEQLPKGFEIKRDANGEPAPRYWPAEFYNSVTALQIDVDRLASMYGHGNGYRYEPPGARSLPTTKAPDPRWLSLPIEEIWNDNPLYLSIDRWSPAAISRLFSSPPASTNLSLGNGAVPRESLAALETCPTQILDLYDDFSYDIELIQALARMPKLESIHFRGCRRPTLEELRILTSTSSLLRIDLSHRGEPYYFSELAELEPFRSRLFAGKVVYQADEAVSQKPEGYHLANFREEHVAAFLDSYRSISQYWLLEATNGRHLAKRLADLSERRTQEAAAVAPAP